MQSTLSLSKQFFIADSALSLWIKAITGSIIVALCAQITIPMYPVPITGQTLGVTVVGLAMGARAGTLALVLYLLEGLIGLPVFAGGSFGLHTLLGPSGGYLFGFVPSAFVLGWASDKGVLKNTTRTVLIAILSSIITFGFGLAQLQYVVKFPTIEALLNAGFTPFILGGVIKAFLASAIVMPAYRFFSKI